MKTRYVKADNVERINYLLSKGYRMYTAHPGINGDPTMLIFIKGKIKE